MNQIQDAMTTKPPTVSIGLPVRNGERFLEEAIESILGQSFKDFELIISDNASTDRTGEICRHYLAKDHRVRYVHNNKDIGGARNENQTINLARGRYFRLAADDDVCYPDLLKHCIAVLEARPDVILCHFKLMRIDEHGRVLGEVDHDVGSSPNPAARFREVIDLNHMCESIYGVMRTDALRETGLMQNYTDSDRTLLARLALRGRFFQIPKVLFHKRYHPGMSTEVYAEWRARMAWFGADTSREIVLPHWAQFIDYLQTILRADVSLVERVKCAIYLAVWIGRYRKWRSLIKDLILATMQLVPMTRQRHEPSADDELAIFP